MINYYHTINAHCQVTGYPKWGFSSFSLTFQRILLYRLRWGLGLSRRRLKIILFWRVMPWIMQMLLPWRLRQYVPTETCQISTRLHRISIEGKLLPKFQYLPTFTPAPQWTDMRQIYGSNINWIAKHPTKEICAHLPYYAAYSGNSLPTFRDNLSVPSLMFKKLDFLILENGTETSVRNYRYTQCNITEQRGYHPLRDGSLESRVLGTTTVLQRQSRKIKKIIPSNKSPLPTSYSLPYS